MLPQRRASQLSTTTDLDKHDSGAGPLTRSKAQESIMPSKTEKTSAKLMPPPSILPKPRAKRESCQTRQAPQQLSNSSSRSSSLARPTAQDDTTTLTKSLAIPNSKKTVTATQSSRHRRSTSHQVAAKAPVTNQSKLPARRPSLQHPSTNHQRPAFSTLQQHFSPKKKSSPLASIESIRQGKVLELESSEIANLQVELSQLHMLHRSAASVQRQWEQSAKQSFQHRFEDLCVRHIELKEIAHQQRTLLNQIALVEWCQGTPSAQIAEKVQQISRNIADIQSLLEPDGKYSRVLEVFQSWFARAQQIQSSRESNIVLNGERGVTVIEGIGDGWKAEAMVLERELTYLLRELKAFGEIRATSSLGRILSLHKTLVSNLMEELDVIQWIENETLIYEGTLLEQTINKLSTSVSKKL